MILYLRLRLAVDGSAGFGQSIRFLYLTGHLSQDRMKKLDEKNFKKWNKINKKSFDNYLNEVVI